MRRCPRCGGTKFIANAHVVQTWTVDGDGDCIDVINDCMCVAHYPDNDDIWECGTCHYSDWGDKFYVDDDE